MNATAKGALIASMVAGLVACGGSGQTAAAPSGEGGSPVKCGGINKCAGSGACSTGEHKCAGQNKCAGKGWVKVSAAECSEKGGTVL